MATAGGTLAGAEGDLRQRLEEVRFDFGLPAVAGGYVTPQGEVVVAVSGVRRAGAALLRAVLAAAKAAGVTLE